MLKTFFRRLTASIHRKDLVAYEELKIALVGRPNAGKSTLFNALSNASEISQKAIVSDVPGTTRDRKEGTGKFGVISYKIFDTGGLEEGIKGINQATIAGKHGEILLKDMLTQVVGGIQAADLVFFLVDGKEGITSEDIYFSEILHPHLKEKNVKLLINKVENDEKFDIFDMGECYKLGLGDPAFISADQKMGLGVLYQFMEEAAVETDIEDIAEDVDELPVRISLVGRPNVGKSTLTNSILGEERVITGPIAGLTRDCISTEFRHNDKLLSLIDTAGIRKKHYKTNDEKKIKYQHHDFQKRAELANSYDEEVQLENEFSEKVEWQGIQDSLRALELCEVAVVVVDIAVNINVSETNYYLMKADVAIVRKCFEEGKPVVLAANKYDLLPESRSGEEFRLLISKEVNEQLAENIDGGISIPVILLSATNKDDVTAVLDKALEIYEKSAAYIPTRKLNNWLAATLKRHQPPGYIGVKQSKRTSKRLKLKFINQHSTKPPSFSVYTNRRRIADRILPDTYIKFMLQDLRKSFELNGVPLRIQFKSSSG